MSVETFPSIDMIHLGPNQLNLTALCVAIDRHREMMAFNPTTLIVAAVSEQVDRAYRLVGPEFPGIPQMVVVPVPGLPEDTWMVTSPNGALVIAR